MPADGLDDIHDLTQRLLKAEMRVIDGLIHTLESSKTQRSADEQVITSTILLMLQSMGVSLHSITKLTGTVDMSVKDCFSISRNVVEAAINVAYIATSDVGVAQRAQAHALQKRFRDFNRSGEIAGTRISVGYDNPPEMESIQGLKDALELFTDKNGKEIRDWSPATQNEKIEQVQLVSEQAALSLAGAKFAIYRHSSEILHGTYFGTIYFWTRDNGEPVTRDTFKEHWTNSLLMSVFTGAFFAGLGAVEACAERFNLQSSIENVKALRAELESKLQTN
ncbi:DUF5677 domain-containing protein [Hyphomonas sp.]|uniref:DUF5677 domain-containing protein n=1 Tax=Hyphomonas sp. TaxID=87 RepID=UPI00352940E6